MTAVLIDGKAAAAQLRAEVADEVATLPTSPGLATLLVGDDPASHIYVANKRKLCTQVGMRDLHRHVPGDVAQAELAEIIDGLAGTRTSPGSCCSSRCPVISTRTTCSRGSRRRRTSTA